MMPTAPVGYALREARTAAGLTIDELAVRAGIGSATVERIELRRVNKPNRATLLALALALSTSTEKSEARAGNSDLAKLAVMGDGRNGP